MRRYFVVILLASMPLFGRADEPPVAVPVAESSTTQANETSADAEAAEEQTTSFWMQKKLEHSQAILRGLAMGDFEEVKNNATRLKMLNRVEGFVRRRNPEYRLHLNTFSRLSSEIERQADKQNIEGATLAFNQLTVSCVDCHKSIRSEPQAAAE